MARRTAFIDESKRGRYMLCAVTVVNVDVAGVRRQLHKAKRAHSTIHMKSLNPTERMAMARLLPTLGIDICLFSARGGRERVMRDVLLDQAARHLVDLEVTELVIESCGQDHDDARILQRALRNHPGVRFRFAGKDELMLAPADVHAWCWGRGGKFKDIVKPITTDLGTIEL